MEREDCIYTHNMLKALMEISDEGIIAIDLEQKITYLNKVAAQSFDISIEDAIGKDIKQILETTTLYKVMEEKKEEIGFIFQKNNREFIANRRPIFNGDEVIGALGMFVDITDYKKVNTALDEEKYHSKILENILETAYDWIVLVDKEGIITMMSKAYLDFVGFTKEEAIGSHVSKIIPNSRMHIVAKTGKAEHGDIQEINGNHMIATRLPIIVDGKIIGAVGKVHFKDISDFNIMAKKVSNMENELEFYKKELKKALGVEYSFDSIIGTSESIMNIKRFSAKVAKSKSNILILGDSGTGKELFAHAIHNASPRAEYPLIKINCAAIPENLLESELFGYESGAFTGAKKEGKPGKFELAHKSTIFLDEIGDMPLSLQAKLLRVIQEREIERIGSIRSQKIDVRIIAATNRNLEDMVKQKEFREDLYYRLNVINIKIPPIRDRREDIPVLAKYLTKKLSKDMGKIITDISYEAMEAIVGYNWPGNIRELENVMERALNLIDKDSAILLEHLPYYITKHKKMGYQYKDQSLKTMVEELEKRRIQECLENNGGNKYEAAKILGISRTSLYQKIQKYCLKV